MIEYLFVQNIVELLWLCAAVFLGGVVRGSIGFGFSALVVASTGFFLPLVAVVAMVVLLEIIASIMMHTSTSESVDLGHLQCLVIGGIPTVILGIWLLTTMDPTILQVVLACYFLFIALMSLSQPRLPGRLNGKRLLVIGAFAGLFNGLGGVGGIAIGTALASFRVSVKQVRATMVMYFLIIEFVFLAVGFWYGLYAIPIFITTVAMCVPLYTGIVVGNKVFNSLSESVMRTIVLCALFFLSILGLYKTLFW